MVSVEWEGRRSALVSKPHSGSVAPLWIPAEMCPLLSVSGYSPCCASETSSSVLSCRIITCVEIFTASRMPRTVPRTFQFCGKYLLIDDLNSCGPPREGMLRIEVPHSDRHDSNSYGVLYSGLAHSVIEHLLNGNNK